VLVPVIAGRGRARKEHGRTAIDGRGERTKACRRFRVRMDETGLPVFLIRHGEIVALVLSLRSKPPAIVACGNSLVLLKPRATTPARAKPARSGDPGLAAAWLGSPL